MQGTPNLAKVKLNNLGVIITIIKGLVYSLIIKKLIK